MLMPARAVTMSGTDGDENNLIGVIGFIIICIVFMIYALPVILSTLATITGVMVQGITSVVFDLAPVLQASMWYFSMAAIALGIIQLATHMLWARVATTGIDTMGRIGSDQGARRIKG